jgi:hypothetical protein
MTAFSSVGTLGKWEPKMTNRVTLCVEKSSDPTFSDLKAGELFIYDPNTTVYMKVKGIDGAYYGLNLESGNLYNGSGPRTVRRIKCAKIGVLGFYD